MTTMSDGRRTNSEESMIERLRREAAAGATATAAPPVDDSTKRASSSSVSARSGPSPSSNAATNDSPPDQVLPSASKSPSGSGAKDGSASSFECNICFDTPSEPVATRCGHIYCWGCLSDWLSTDGGKNECPVCKAGVSIDSVIPLYTGGETPKASTRTRPTPPRPKGERPTPTPRRGGAAASTGASTNRMRNPSDWFSQLASLPIWGAFCPFGVSFGMTFQMGQNQSQQGGGGNRQEAEQEALRSTIANCFVALALALVLYVFFSY